MADYFIVSFYVSEVGEAWLPRTHNASYGLPPAATHKMPTQKHTHTRARTPKPVVYACDDDEAPNEQQLLANSSDIIHGSYGPKTAASRVRNRSNSTRHHQKKKHTATESNGTDFG